MKQGKDKTEEIKQALEAKTGHEVSLDNVEHLIAGWLMSGKEIEELLFKLTGEEVEYSDYTGFATPSLVCFGSDVGNRGYIIDTESNLKMEGAQGLMCGWWSKGFFDDNIHLYLCEPVAAICDKRQGWINKQMLLKEPISVEHGYSTEGAPVKQPRSKPEKKPMKKTLVLDSETKQFRLI